MGAGLFGFGFVACMNGRLDHFLACSVWTFLLARVAVLCENPTFRKFQKLATGLKGNFLKWPTSELRSSFLIQLFLIAVCILASWERVACTGVARTANVDMFLCGCCFYLAAWQIRKFGNVEVAFLLLQSRMVGDGPRT